MIRFLAAERDRLVPVSEPPTLHEAGDGTKAVAWNRDQQIDQNVVEPSHDRSSRGKKLPENRFLDRFGDSHLAISAYAPTIIVP